MAGRIQLRRDTAANWAAANPILAAGEKGLETDTGREKNGNGVDRWNDRPYVDGVAAGGLAAHLADTVDAHAASAIGFTPTSTISATNLQAAIVEVDAEHVNIPAAPPATVGDILTKAGTTGNGDTAWTTRAAMAADPAFSGRFSRIADSRTGNRTIILGDSIAAGDDDFSTPAEPPGSWFSRLCAASGQRMRYFRNAGIPANTTANMLARVQTDVIAFAPDWCIVPLTTNDATVTPQATVRANYIAIIDALVTAGIRPICATMTPSDSLSKLPDTTQINAWLIEWANRRGYPVFDLYSILADPADGTYLSGLQIDGTHPNEAGYEAIVAALLPQIPATMQSVPILSTINTDPTNAVASPLFLVDSNADGTPDNWARVGTGTASLVAGAPSGQWARLVTTGTNTCRFAQIISGSAWAIGDRMRFAVRWQSAGTVATTISVVQAGGSPVSQIAIRNHAMDTGAGGRVAYVEWVIPSGVSSLEVRLEATGNGTTQFAQPTLVNMTRWGLTA